MSVYHLLGSVQGRGLYSKANNTNSHGLKHFLMPILLCLAMGGLTTRLGLSRSNSALNQKLDAVMSIGYLS